MVEYVTFYIYALGQYKWYSSNKTPLLPKEES